MLTVDQAAKILQFDRKKVYDLCRGKKIPTWQEKKWGAIRIPRDELAKVINGAQLHY
jgi:excisionase family DNA binding protein